MTWDPTKGDRFLIIGEMCIVFDYFLYEVQLEFNPIQGFKAGHRVRKYESWSLLRRTKYMARVIA